MIDEKTVCEESAWLCTLTFDDLRCATIKYRLLESSGDVDGDEYEKRLASMSNFLLCIW